MKISVLTPTYNRATLLKKLYNSLIENSKYNVDIEWLIMDDGSKDNTKKIVEDFIKEKKIEIKYYYQENQGKMVALNKLVGQASGELIIDCDSDDYFTEDAFDIISKAFLENKNTENVYGICFLKYNQNGENMGNSFRKNKTTMFDLYFKEGETGEKSIVFYSNIRKKYCHKLEKNEKFITEARLYHELDLKYCIICVNKPIMICEYQNEGYSKNILKNFKESPFGYFEYFKEIFMHSMKGVKFNKRLYAIKHYILFLYLTKNKKGLKNVKGIYNKILYIPRYGKE